MEALERLITLLQQGDGTPFTISELRARGIKAPGQTLYELELRGYRLERIRRRGPMGHTTLAYRLSGDGNGVAPPA